SVGAGAGRIGVVKRTARRCAERRQGHFLGAAAVAVVEERAGGPLELLVQQHAVEAPLDRSIGEALDAVGAGKPQRRAVLVGAEQAVPVAPGEDQLGVDGIGQLPVHRGRDALLIQVLLAGYLQPGVGILEALVGDIGAGGNEAAVVVHAVPA